MVKKRLIDCISEVRDTVPVEQDWMCLMEPFIFALRASPDIVAKHAYSEVEGSPQWKYLRLKLDAILRLETNSAALKHNLDVLLGPESDGLSVTSDLSASIRPILIVGEPGIGKTTWLLHFFSQQFVEERCYYYRFDGLVTQDPFEELPFEQFIRRRVRTGLISSLREICQRRKIETPAAELSPGQIDDLSDSSVGRIIRQSVDELARQGIIGLVIIDNLDRQPRSFQTFAVDYALSLTQANLRVIITAPSVYRTRTRHA